MSASIIIGGQLDSIGRGSHDDNREGTILTKVAQGDLVRVPIPSTALLTTVGSATNVRAANGLNPDGSAYGVSMTVPSGINQGAIIKTYFYGRVFGVRFQRTSGSTDRPFSVKVDGVVYAVRNTLARRNAQYLALTDYESLFIIADDLLTDGPHTVEISLMSEPSASRSLIIYGFLCERSKGYETYPQIATYVASPQAVTTSAVAITASGFPVRQLRFYNTSSATRTVTIKNGSNTVCILQLAAATTAASPLGQASPDSALVDLGMPSDASLFTVQADATGVNLFTQQGVRNR
jgi:hypothetical protein